MAELSQGLERFKRLLTDVKTLTGWGIKGGVAAPLADFIVRLGPPWPSQLPILTALLQIVVLIILATFVTARFFKKVMVAATLVCGLSLAGYLFCSSAWIHEAPDGQRLVAGFKLRADVAGLIGPTYFPHEALRDSGWNPLEVWTAESITAAKLALVALWFSLFASFVVIVGTFAIKQSTRRGERNGQ